jgi:cysteine-rich repeat protein
MPRVSLACALAVLSACVASDDGQTGDEQTTVSETSGDPTTQSTRSTDTPGEPDTDPTPPLTTGTHGPCGDGILDEHESCDAGADNDDNGACTTACRHATCGDGLVHLGVEWCDDGNQNNSDSCLVDCYPATCGDGFLGPGELCDDGNVFDNDACPSTCSKGGCGDGFVQAGEQCDDGNLMNGDACLASCEHATCGDGVVHIGVEQCDDGNDQDADTCGNDCVQPRCDDGIKNGFESDLDCGGNTCAGCQLGELCLTNLDCHASICQQGACSPAQDLMPPNCAPASVAAAQVYDAVKPNCGCHANGAGSLKFTSAASFRDSMVDVDPTTATMKLALPGDIHQSYVIYKILNQQGSVVGGSGGPMPLGKPLSDDKKCLMINWVKSGAK